MLSRCWLDIPPSRLEMLQTREDKLNPNPGKIGVGSRNTSLQTREELKLEGSLDGGQRTNGIFEKDKQK